VRLACHFLREGKPLRAKRANKKEGRHEETADLGDGMGVQVEGRLKG